MIVAGPVGVAGCFVHVTVILTPLFESDWVLSHVLLNASCAGVALFVRSQTWSLFRVAVMVLLSDCGVIRFTGIDSVFLPSESPESSNMYDWSDEPEYWRAPSASRW